MAESFFPFDAGAGATVLETQWQKMARRWLSTGVLEGYLNQLAVTADGSALSVSVATGGAWVEGFYFDSDTAKALTIATANATNPRIDRVVVRLDRTANTITTAVLTGTAAASPVPPTLTQTDTLYELLLANVTVPAAAGVIVAGNVSDQRSFAQTAVAPLTLTSSGAAVKPLVVKGASGQTANHLEVRTSGDVVQMSVNGGDIRNVFRTVSGPVDAAGVLSGSALNSGSVVLAVRGASGQTANLAEFQNSVGTVLAAVNNGGALHVGNVATAATLGAFVSVANSVDAAGLVVRGSAGQTANLATFQNSSGTVLAGVAADGGLIFHGGLVTTSAAAGAASALPATPAGYLFVTIAGVARKLPYYA